MNIAKKRELLLKQLEENFALLEHSIKSLEYSYKKCELIDLKHEYSLEELESFEALTSRFARTSDILTQKVFKTLFMLLQENLETFIDRANFLEKIQILETADQILNIRELRNEISHEYKETELKSLFEDILKYIPELIDIINKTKNYIKSKFLKKPF